jgi:GntR family transcriptional repressor for pyruvate dehydrogenase complex
MTQNKGADLNQSAVEARRHGQPMADEAVVAYVRKLIESGEFSSGDRLPAERDLATRVGVSRPSVRTALHALAALGVVESRHGSGTYITLASPFVGGKPLGLLASLHGITDHQLFEVRKVLELDIAELAAQRATAEHLVAISEEVMECFAFREDPQRFLVHDIGFHRAVAHAAENPMLAALLDMVADFFYEQRKDVFYHWQGAHAAAEHHRKIFHAIRDHDPELARKTMDIHLRWALKVQQREREEVDEG